MVRQDPDERREALLAMLDSEGWQVARSVLRRRLGALERQGMAVADMEALAKLQAGYRLLKDILEAPERFFAEE